LVSEFNGALTDWFHGKPFSIIEVACYTDRSVGIFINESYMIFFSFTISEFSCLTPFFLKQCLLFTGLRSNTDWFKSFLLTPVRALTINYQVISME
jgi:hypothetical protein